MTDIVREAEAELEVMKGAIEELGYLHIDVEKSKELTAIIQRLLDVVKEREATQQALDTAMRTLEDIRAYALANENDITNAQSAAQMVTTLKAITQSSINKVNIMLEKTTTTATIL